MTAPRVIPFRGIWEERGSLHVCEQGDSLPFAVNRFFLLYADLRESKRGGYASRRQHEMLVAVGGTARVTVNGRSGRREFVLVNPQCGLYLPPMTWCEVTLLRRSQLLVLASGVYDEADHIRDIPTFEDEHATA